MSHAPFAAGVLPGVTSGGSSSGSISGGGAGTSSGAGSALLPTVTAELRNEFVPLLATLASCKSDLAATYVMELFFTLVRFDAVLKAKERQLFVTTAQQLITRQLQQLQKVHHTRTLLDENERFVGELVERCAALECLCLAPDYDGDGAVAEGGKDGVEEEEEEEEEDEDADGDDVDTRTNDFVEVRSRATPTLRLDDADDGHGDGGETAHSVATARPAAVTTSAVRHRYPAGAAAAGGGGAAVAAFSTPIVVGSSHTFSESDLRRFSFDDSLDDIASRAAAFQHAHELHHPSRQPHLHRRPVLSPDTPASATDLTVAGGDGGSGSGSVAAATTTAESSAASTRPRYQRRPPPLPLRWTAADGTTPTPTTAAGPALASASRVGVGDGSSGSLHTTLRRRGLAGHANSTGTSPCDRGGSAPPAPAGDVTPAVYSGVQHALQKHFRNNVRRTLTGGTALTVPNNLNELVLQQPPQQPLQQVVPDVSPTSSPGPARHSFPAALYTAAPPPVANLSIFSMGTATSQSALYPNGSFHLLGIDAGGPLGLTLGAVHSSSGGGGGGGGGLSSGCSPTTQEPVDTARVWDRVFWRFLDGRSATGDLAVLLELLNTGNRAHTPAPTLTAAMGGGSGTTAAAPHTASRGGGGGGGAAGAASGGAGTNAKGPQVASTAMAAGHLSSAAATTALPHALAMPSAGASAGGTAGSGASAGGAGGGGGDVIGAAGPRGPASAATPPHAPDLGATPLMEALRRSGSYAQLLPPLSPPPLVVSGGTAVTAATPAVAVVAAPWHDAPVTGSGGVSLEATVVVAAAEEGDGGDNPGQQPQQQQQQQRHGSGPGGDTPAPLPPLLTARTPAPGSHANPGAGAGSSGSGSNTVLLNLEDFAREEETRLHRDFWTHIPAILATLTEGLMYSGGGRGGGDDGDDDGDDDGGRTDGGAVPLSKRHRGSRPTSAADLAGGEVASTRMGGGGDEQRIDGGGAAYDDDAGDGTAEGGAEALGALHPPSAEALQLLPTFSPLLRNYTAAVQRLTRQAPEYARTTQAQHARALAVVAAAATATTPPPNVDGATTTTTAAATGGEASPETERSGTATPAPATATAGNNSVSRVSGGGGGGGLTRTSTQRTSVTDLPELKDSYTVQGAGRTQANSSSQAPAVTTALEQSLLNTGSRSQVRPVDVVAYALVTAIYVQCATALEAQQQQQHAAAAAASGAGGRATAVPTSTSGGAEGVSRSDDGGPSAGDTSPQGTWAWPGATSSGASFAADVAALSAAAANPASTATTTHTHTATTTAGAAANNASLSAPGDEERAGDASVANASLTYVGVGGGPGWWWNGSLSGAGGGLAGSHSLNGSIGLAANTFYYPYVQPLASALRNSGPGHVSGYVSNASFHLLQPHRNSHSAHQRHNVHASPRQLASPTHGDGAAASGSQSPPHHHTRHAHTQSTPQQLPLLRNFSFDAAYSPTDAALSLLRAAQEEMANGVAGDVAAGDGCSCSRNDDSSAAPADASQLPPSLPRGNLHAMQLPSPELVSCANDFSWVSLPSVMKAELQHLQQQLRDAARSSQRMEGQVRGELALLLFRVLSLVLDWLMPAVYVADQRVWLFYRKWCCDLYRVLCTDVALLEEFHRLLNQSGLAIGGSVAESASEAGSPRTRRAVSLRATTGLSGRATARSATSTPTLRPAREPTSAAAMAASGLAGGVGGGPGMAQTPPQPHPRPSGSPTTTALASVLDVAEEGAPNRHTRGTGSARPVLGAAASASSATAVESLSTASPLVDRLPPAAEDAFSFILPGSSLAVSVWQERPPMPPGVRSLLEQEEANRRGEAWVDTASLRAAKALLGGEGTVVPLPRPVLITRLVAATLRGIDADVAESLLWVVGQARAVDADDEQRLADARQTSNGSSCNGSGGVGAVGSPGPSTQQQQQQQAGRPASVASRSRGRRARRYGDLASAAAAAAAGEDDEDDASDEDVSTWSTQPRTGHAAATRTMSGQHLHHAPTAATASHHHSRHHRSTSADVHSRHHRLHHHVPSSARAAAPGGGGGGYGLHSEGDNEHEHDDAGYGDQWFAEADRRRRSHAGAVLQPVRSPVMAHSPGTLLAASMGASSMFPRTDTRASLSDVNSTSGGSPQLSRAPQLSEGPTLVHHHRFRYPAVHGYADVAKLYLSTLEEAELVLSAHDPVYASLVLSAADLHLHDLHDRATAASLVHAYLADVGGEHIQGPVWEALPAVSSVVDGAAATPGGAPPPTLSAPTARPAAPGKGFSVTRVRQGHTQGPTSTTGGPRTTASTPASSPSPSLQQQQPHVPMVIASWNNEGEKDEFLATLQLLRQMQLFLAVAGTDDAAVTDGTAT